MRITANMVTLTRIVLMPIPGYLLYGGASELVVALVAIGLLGLTDWIDGIMARREGPSVLGGLLDPIADKIFITVIYLPLTELGIIPPWMTACIFCRDSIVTALRTSLSLRDAPMRTSTLAKFKTAMQMIGIGYIVLYLAFASEPNSYWVWAVVTVPIFMPLSVILYRLIKQQKQGLRSLMLFTLTVLAMTAWYFAGPHMATIITLYVITGMTVISGFSYLVDAWSALKGKPGSIKEILRFILDGLLVPVVFVYLLGRYNAVGMSAMIILILTLELTVSGLENLLASKKITPRFRWMAVKSISQLALAGTALALDILDVVSALPLGESCIVAAMLVTITYFVLSFWRNRSVYRTAI